MKRLLLFLTSLLTLASSPLASAAQVPQLVAAFSGAAMEFPESIAIDSAGNCYLGMVPTGVVKKVTPAGVQSVYAVIKDEYILGLAFDGADNLYVAGGAGIWKVTATGAISLFSSIPGALNDLAFAPDGNLYTTWQLDDKTGAVWKVDKNGVGKAWCTSPLFLPVASSFMPGGIGINGVAVDPQNRFVYVNVTSAGRIVEIRINADGSAGTLRVVVENSALVGTDGLRLDDRGNFYTAINLLNRITKVTPDGKLTDIASGGSLTFPTSLALDTRNGRTTMYICNDGDFFFGTTQHDQGLFKISNPDPSRLLEVSTRGQVDPSNMLLSGFVVDGTSSKTLLVRAVGPTLANFGVTGALADPKLEIYGAASATTPIASNDNWNGDAALVTAAAASGAFALSSATSKDAAMLVTLPPGTYTARVTAVGSATGNALLEIYEVP